MEFSSRKGYKDEIKFKYKPELVGLNSSYVLFETSESERDYWKFDNVSDFEHFWMN